MPEEVKIVVREEQQGKAVADAAKDVDQLKAKTESATKATEAQAAAHQKVERAAKQQAQSQQQAGATGQTAAAPAQAQSTDAHEKAEKHARNRAAENKKAAEAAEREEAALKKPGIAKGGHGGAGGSFGGARMVGEVLDMTTGTQGWVMRSMMMQRLPHMLSSMAANPAMLVATAALAYGAYQYKAFEERQKDESEQNKLREEKASDRFKRVRAGSILGSSSESVASALSAQEEIAAREEHRAELERAKRDSFGGIVDRFLGTNFASRNIFGFKTSGQRAVDENEREIERLKEKKTADEKAAQKTFMGQEGGLELDALRQRSKRTLAGQRAQFVDQMSEEWLKTYRDIFSKTKDDRIASEMAGLTVQNELRDRQAAAGAGLVDLRSGGAEIAAAARWSMQTPNWSDIGAKIEGLHDTVRRSNQQIEDLSKR